MSGDDPPVRDDPPVGEDPPVREGFVAPALAAEFPGLRVAWIEVPAAGGPSPPALRERLRGLSDRLRGAQAIALRGRDVPHAYRVFFRHIGLEPDEVRIPIEALVLERLLRGRFPSRGRLPDALAIACIETGLPVWGLDADRLIGSPGVRPSEAAERMGAGPPLAPGRLVLADESRPLAILFEAPGEPVAPDRGTTRLALVTVVVPGVPVLFAEEALWMAAEALET
jgi:DNA/RNA-binding domain of Phe-tRNA-synthetase-like protein